MYRRNSCRLCNQDDLQLLFTLAATPPANDFVNEEQRAYPQPRYPLELMQCGSCGHVQIPHVVSPDILFRNYVYVSGTSPSFVQHFQDYAASVCQRVGAISNPFVIDIGSNDGTLLGFYQQAGARVLGVDPARDIARKATAEGIPTIPEFFTSDLAATILSEHGQADIITANNVFAHSDHLDDIVDAVSSLLNQNGIFVFEVSYLLDVFNNTLFDTIYHEHLSYHSVKPLLPFFERFGMTVFDVELVPSHGGSIRVFVQKQTADRPVSANVADRISAEEDAGLYVADTYQRFHDNIRKTGGQLRETIRDLVANGKTVAGYGAPAKATTLMYEFGLGAADIAYIIDDSPLKQGLYSPGLHIPVVSSAILTESPPDYLVILAWNFADPIIRNNATFVENGGHFIVPLPNFRMV